MKNKKDTGGKRIRQKQRKYWKRRKKFRKQKDKNSFWRWWKSKNIKKEKNFLMMKEKRKGIFFSLSINLKEWQEIKRKQ